MLFDDIAIVYIGVNDIDVQAEDALERLNKLLNQFDALAPDWTQAPEWAQWYTIGSTGRGVWWSNEPAIDEWRWDLSTVTFMYDAMVDIPIGIDWRLCKWQRP